MILVVIGGCWERIVEVKWCFRAFLTILHTECLCLGLVEELSTWYILRIVMFGVCTGMTVLYLVIEVRC